MKILKRRNYILIILLLASVVLGCVLLSGCVEPDNGEKNRFTGSEYKAIPFESEEELMNYWKSNDSESSAKEMKVGGGGMEAFDNVKTLNAPAAPVVGSTSTDSRLSGRFSETNVQEAGVDEADIIKTDGKHIYYKTNRYYDYYNYIYDKNNTKREYVPEKIWVIDALPQDAAKIVSDINETCQGFYLIDENIVIVSYDSISCYDISDRENPKKLWKTNFNPERETEEDYEKYKDVPYTNYMDSRVIDGKMYLVTSQHGKVYPILYGMDEIPATKIYGPTLPGYISDIPENKYIISEVDIETGELKNSVVVLGNWQTKFYSSKENIYLASHYSPDETKVFNEYLKEYGESFLPEDVMKHITRVMENEDFGENAKNMQIREILGNYTNSLSFDEAKEFQEEINEKYSKYLIEVLKENEKTGIVRVNLKTMEITSGEVPGSLLNSYSMDEHDGYLRVGVTVGNNWRTSEQMTNAVYVLDKDLNTAGYIDGIAEGERIYSTRFMGDTLYMVTFEEVDPFFVIDLSDPENPNIMGELKIPGFSTYLHPVGENLVVGVGQIERNSKLSLFDVTDPNAPKELSTYEFKEYTQAAYDFHAFLWDADTKTLVIPAGEHAYIFNVDENGISLKKDDVHKNTYVRRTVYINDGLYTFSQKEMHIIDMNTWDIVNVIEFPTETVETDDFYDIVK